MFSQEQYEKLSSKLDKLISLSENQASKLYPAKQAAAYLGVSMGYLYKLTHGEKITFHKPGGKLL